MAVKLNLLPSDYTVSKPVAAVLKVVRPLNVTLLAVFLASALGMAGFFIFSSVTLKNLNSVNNNLKSQIQSQQAAQQQVVLLKDRLSKIQRVQSTPGASKNLALVIPFVNAIGDDSVLTELDLDSQKTALSIGFKSNTNLTNFIKSLNSQSPFSSITLNSFNYNPVSGYLVEFSLTGTDANAGKN